MERMRCSLLHLCAALFVAGCGPSQPAAAPSAEAPASSAASSSSASPTAAETPPPAAKKAPEREVLASESSPPGLNPVPKEELDAAQKTCKPLAEAIAAAARKKKLAGAAERDAFLSEFLANPPKLPNVDVAKCSDLLLRDLKAYRATMIESEAKMNIGRVLVGLSVALESEPPELCASAGPVPADLNALASGPWVSKPEDWSAPGFRCARFALGGEPQRFQYQIVTDKGAGTWEVIARGFPVKGAPPTELYARGRIENGQIKKSRDVFRRSTTR